MKQSKIEVHVIQSEALGEEMEILVHLPKNYTPLNKYPVLITSDGKDYIQYGHTGRVIDSLSEEGEMESVIYFGIPYKSVKERRRMYHPEGDRQEAYIRFLAHELVPFIDENYPTYQVGAGRTLMGDSLAATVSLQTAAKYPNLFGSVILHSPFVNDQVLDVVNDINDPAAFFIYHVIGDQETEVKTAIDGIQDFLTPNRQLNELLVKKGFEYFYEEFKGDHTWKYWQPDIPRALKEAFCQL